MQKTYDLQINFRPVYPIAIRTPDFFLQVNPLWPPYLLRDSIRVAQMLDMPFVWPNPDPVKQYRGDDGRARTADEQPYIHRLTRLGALAQEQGQGLEFANEVSNLIWAGTPNWHEGDLLAQATERAGLNLVELDQRIIDEEERIEAVIEANQGDHEASGHWGVPTCTFEGEPFFGQDRLDVLLWRLRQAGLSLRT